MMRDVDRIVRKLQSQQCPELQDAETRLIGEDDDNLGTCLVRFLPFSRNEK